MTGQDESRYVPVAQAAALLGVKPDSIRKRIRRRQLQAIKPPGSSGWLVLIDGTAPPRPVPAPLPAEDRTATRPRATIQVALDELRAQLAAKDKQIAELHLIVAHLSQRGTETQDVLPPAEVAALQDSAGLDRDTTRDGTAPSWWQRLWGRIML